MHQVKLPDVPHGKFRDKGTPIDNLCNFDSSTETVVYICEDLQLLQTKLLFVTKNAMTKQVDGSEFLVTKRTINATKLQEGDRLIAVTPVHAGQNIVLRTKNGYFLRFCVDEITEKKKGAVGIRGMKLTKNDCLEEIYLFEEGTETKISYREKEVSLNRLKSGSRDTQGVKYRK